MSDRDGRTGARDWVRLLPWILVPIALVALAVLWMWLGGEGGFSSAGRYDVAH